MASFTSRTAPSNDLLDQRKLGRRVALLGDTYADINNDYAAYPTTVQTSARGFFTWANILLRQRCALVVPSTTDGAWGGTGQTAAALLTNGEATAAAASASDIVVVLAGNFDVVDGANYTAAQIAANLLSIWQRILAAGKLVVALTILPRNAGDTAAQTQKLRDVNRLIRKNAAATPGVFLCDWYSAVVSASTSLANTAYYADGTTLNTLGATRLGAALAAVLDRIVPPGADDLAFDNADTQQFLTNPLMIGTSGSTSNSSGTVADGWAVYGNPTSCSKVARSDLGAGEWQQIVMAAGQNFALQNNPGVGGTNQAAVGDLVYGAAEFETDAASWGATQLSITLEFSGSTNIARGPSYVENVTFLRPPSGILRTPAIPVPSGATTVKINLNAFGAGTFRFGRSLLAKVQ